MIACTHSIRMPRNPDGDRSVSVVLATAYATRVLSPGTSSFRLAKLPAQKNNARRPDGASARSLRGHNCLHRRMGGGNRTVARRRITRRHQGPCKARPRMPARSPAGPGGRSTAPMPRRLPFATSPSRRDRRVAAGSAASRRPCCRRRMGCSPVASAVRPFDQQSHEGRDRGSAGASGPPMHAVKFWIGSALRGSPDLRPGTAPRGPGTWGQPRTACASWRRPYCLSVRIERGALRSTTSRS